MNGSLGQWLALLAFVVVGIERVAPRQIRGPGLWGVLCLAYVFLIAQDVPHPWRSWVTWIVASAGVTCLAWQAYRWSRPKTAVYDFKRFRQHHPEYDD